MKTNIQIFTSDIFGEIRTCQVNNQIMFVGKDVATALGYSNSQKAIRDHVDDDDKLTERFVLSGQARSVIIINESGLGTTGDRFMIQFRITEPVPIVRKPSTRPTASPFRTVHRLMSTRKRGLPNSNPLFP